MPDESQNDITCLLERLRTADASGQAPATDQLVQAVYERLRRMAGRLLPPAGQAASLQATDLLDEALVRLLQSDLLQRAPNRAYFFGAACKAMRRVLADRARWRNQLKRGGGKRRVPLDDVPASSVSAPFDTVEFHDALDVLTQQYERAGNVITLRALAGFTVSEVAEQLGISISTVEEDTRFARAWLRKELGLGPSHVS